MAKLLSGTRIYGTGTVDTQLIVSGTTNASSTITGALTVTGGAGIGGNLYVGGDIVANKLTIQLTTVTTTNVTTDDIISTYNTTNATNTNSGALQVTGGAGIGQDLWVGGAIYSNGTSVGYGYTGSIGYTGSRGYDGSRGNTGYDGSKGVDGYSGSVGFVGSVGAQGPQGVMGYTGSKGDTGAQGPQGVVGPQGPQGPEGYTGSRGVQGPQGYTGSKGDTGAQGPQGVVGPQGPQGIIGYTGSKGDTGAQGPQGVTGPQGPQGPQGIMGYTGSKGDTGPQGPQGVTGPQGPQGPQGIMGYTGSQGVAGPQGPQGVAGPQGPQGIMGYTGSKGDTGAQGPQGVAGPQGPQGVMGYTGSKGDTGAQGPQGVAGPQGPQGILGYTGSKGDTGAQGPQGVTGPQGPIGYSGSAGPSDALKSVVTATNAFTWVVGVQTTGTNASPYSAAGIYFLPNNNTFVATGAMRAPVYYDINNTAFYTAPSVSSRIRSLSALGSEASTHDPYGLIGVTRGNTTTNYSYYGMTKQGIVGMGMGIDSNNYWWFGGASGGADGTRTSTYFYADTSGNLVANSSMSAPIFYDKDDTAYYTDPAGTSKLRHLQVGQAAGGPGVIQVYEAESLSVSGTGSTVSDTSASSGQVFSTAANGLLFGPYTSLPRGNYRMTVRIKVADATYSGNVAVINVYSAQAWSQSRTIRGVDFRANDTWETFSVPFTVTATNSGTMEYYVQGQNSRQIYVDYVMILPEYDSYTNKTWGNSLVAGTLGVGTDAPSSSYKIDVSGSIRVSSAVYTPIMYDSDNTGYYVDPASTTNLNNLTVNGTLSVPGGFSQLNLGPERQYYLGNILASGTQARRVEIARLFLDVNNWHVAGTTFVELQNSYFMGGDWQKWAINYDYNGATGVISCDLIEGNSPRGRYAQVTTSSPVQYSGAYYYVSIYVDVRYYASYYAYIKTSVPAASSASPGNVSGYIWVYTNPTVTPGYSNISDFTPSTTVYTNNNLWSGGTVRGTSFTDSDNTSYYIDPDNGGFNLKGGTSNRVTYSTNDSGFKVYNAEGNGVSDVRLGAAWGAPGVYSSSYLMLGSENYIEFRIANSQKGYMDSSSNLFAYGSMRSPIFYDYNDTAYYLDPASTSNLNYVKTNSIVTSNVRTNANEKAPLGHYAPGEEVFAIDTTWSNTQLQAYFNSGSVSWYADSSAPGGYAIQISGGVNVSAGAYGSGFPYIPAGTSDIYYMEVWIKNDGGSSGTYHYMGSIDYNESFGNLGGNPGSYGYWVMSGSNPGTSWTKYSGYISGFGNSVGQWKSGTKYWSPQALFNYNGGTSYISGWKVIKVYQPGNRTFTGSISTPDYIYAARFVDYNNNSYYVDPASGTVLAGSITKNGNTVPWVVMQDTAPSAQQYGDLWWESDTGKLKIYYNDGSSAQWVDASPTPDLSPYYLKAGGGITGPVVMASSLHVEGTTFLKKTNITAIGAGWNDHLNMFSSDGSNYWNLLVDSGASNSFRIAYNQSEKMRIFTSTYTEIYGSARSPIFYDLDDTGYYLDPNSTSNSALRIRGGSLFGPNPSWGEYLQVGGNGDNGTWAQITTTNGNLHLDGRRGGYGIYLQWYNGGAVYVENQIQATIFYDRNDTGYYVDPNSSSNLAGLTSSTYTRFDLPFRKFNRSGYTGDSNYWTGSVGWGTSVTWATAWSYGHNGFDIWGGSTDHPQGSGYVHAQGIQSGMHYATSDSGSAYGWQMVGAADADSRWWLRGKWGGTTRAWYEIVLFGRNVGGSLYANIYYDSDNTGYYCDPNGSSRLSTIYCGDVYNDLGGWFRNYGVTGLYNQSYGNHWYSNNSGYWNVGGGNTSWGGILLRSGYESTIKGYFYWDGGGSGLLDSSGNWKFRMEYGNNNAELYNITYMNDARPYIIYDRNNTGYYVNPDGTSRMYKQYLNYRLVFDANYGHGVFGVYSSYRYQLLWSMGESWVLPDDGTTTGNLYGLAWSHPNAGGAAGNLASHGVILLENGYWQFASGGGSTRSSSNMYSPIYYDLNDSSYYLDPNADLSLKVYGEICNANYAQGNLQPGALNIGRTDYNYNWGGSWSGDVRTGILANCSDNWEFAIHDSGHRVVSPFAFWGGGSHYLEMGRDIGWGTMPIYASNSFRAPIFYDSNDTYYYCDPNGTSRLNRTQSYYFENIYGVGTDHQFGLYFDNGLSTAYAIFREGGAWSWPYPDLRIAFHTGIKFGANSSYKGMNFYTDYDMSSLVLSVNNADYQSGGTWSHGSFWTPITYDTASSGYYVDPYNQASVLNGINLTGLLQTMYMRVQANSPSSGYTFSGGGQPAFWIESPYGDYGGLCIDADGTTVYGAGDYGWVFRVIDEDSYQGTTNNATQALAYTCFQVNQSLNGGGYIRGDFIATGNITAYGSVSDIRRKENIVKIDNALEKISQLNGYTFNFKGDSTPMIGVIAQEVEKVFPELVYTTTAGPDKESPLMAVHYENISAVLIEAVNEQQAIIKEQESRIAKLEEMVNRLLGENNGV